MSRSKTYHVHYLDRSGWDREAYVTGSDPRTIRSDATRHGFQILVIKEVRL